MIKQIVNFQSFEKVNDFMILQRVEKAIEMLQVNFSKLVSCCRVRMYRHGFLNKVSTTFFKDIFFFLYLRLMIKYLQGSILIRFEFIQSVNTIDQFNPLDFSDIVIFQYFNVPQKVHVSLFIFWRIA